MNLSRAVSFLRVGPTIIQEFMEIESSSIISLVDSIRCSVHAHGRFVPEKAEKSRKEREGNSCAVGSTHKKKEGTVQLYKLSRELSF